MPSTTTTRTAAAQAAGAVCAALALCLALPACGVPPELRPKPGSSLPRPSVTSAHPSVGWSPGAAPLLPGEIATPSPTPSFSEEFALPCAGYPSVDEVIAVVRRTGGLVARTATVTELKEPLCAGSWQYTILSVPEREPLQVVTRGTPGRLAMVTAGTNVCSIAVRTSAPAGIRNAALCPPPGT